MRNLATAVFATLFAAAAFGENVVLGSRALSGAKFCDGNVAIGANAMAGSESCEGNVIIGNRELQNTLGMTDTTSINDQQIFVSKMYNAFAINPNKETVISNAPMWYKDGYLHFNVIGTDINPKFNGLVKHYFGRANMQVGGASGTFKISSWYDFDYTFTNLVISIEQRSGKFARVYASGDFHVNLDGWEKDYSLNDTYLDFEVGDEQSFGGRIFSDYDFEFIGGDEVYADFYASLNEDGTYYVYVSVGYYGYSSFSGHDDKYFPNVKANRYEEIMALNMYDDVSPNASNAFVSAIGVHDFFTNMTYDVTNTVAVVSDATNRVTSLEHSANEDRGHFNHWLSYVDNSVKTTRQARVTISTGYPQTRVHMMATNLVAIAYNDNNRMREVGNGWFKPNKIRVMFDYNDVNDTMQHVDEVRSVNNWTNIVFTFKYHDSVYGARTTTINVNPVIEEGNAYLRFGGYIGGEMYMTGNLVRKYDTESEGTIDSVVSERCLSSTKNVYDSLGGMTFKMEDGAFNVYSNGVKIGSLTFTPSN